MRSGLRFILAFALMFNISAHLSFAGFEAGVGLRSITPDPLLPVSGGVGEPKPVNGKRGELTARAMVFRNGEVTVAVAGLDLLGFPSVLGDRVRGANQDILFGNSRNQRAHAITKH